MQFPSKNAGHFYSACFCFFSLIFIILPVRGGDSVEFLEKIPDVRVIIDISGSMKKSDPKNLRIPAAELLVNLFPDGSKAGVWTFGKYVNMLVGHGAVNAQWKKKAVGQVQKINSVALYTNIGKALEVASAGWTEPAPGVQRSIILLTDGVVDIARNAAVNKTERERIISSVLPALRAQQVTVNTIALSRNADKKLMQRLALETGGEFSTVLNPDDLIKVFVETFDHAVKPEQIPLEGNYFSIDQSIDEFTALVFHEKGGQAASLQMPNGEKLEYPSKNKLVQWLRTDSYDLVTVKKPQAGEWQLLADIDLSNRVTVISDLKLRVSSMPKNILQGERVGLSIQLMEQDQLLDKEKFLDLIKLHVTQVHTGGREWSATLGGAARKGLSEPGKFFARFGKTLLPGEHTFTVVADGRTFNRKHTQKINVFDKLLNVTLEQKLNAEKPVFSVKASETGGLLAADQSMLTFFLEDSTGQVKELLLDKQLAQWEGEIQPFSGQGEYKYFVRVVGVSKAGRSIDYKSPVQLFEYYPDGKSEEAELISETVISTVMDESPKVLDEALKPAENKVSQELEVSKALEAPSVEPAKEKMDKPPEAEAGFLESLGTGSLIALLLGGNLLLGGLGYGAYRLKNKLVSKEKTSASPKEEGGGQSESKSVNKPDQAEKTKSEADTGTVAASAALKEEASAEKPDLDEDVLMNDDLESDFDDLEEFDEEDETNLENIDLSDTVVEKKAEVVAETADLSEGDEDKSSDIDDLDDDFDLDIDLEDLLDDD